MNKLTTYHINVKSKELRKYCIKKHREMWNWLADNPDKHKEDWPGWEERSNDLFSAIEKNHCFLCGYISGPPSWRLSRLPD